MTKTELEAGCDSTLDPAQTEPHSIAALPRPLLESILTRCTSLRDKKSFRLTSKLFQEISDDSLACIKLTKWQRHGCKDSGTFMKRLQHLHCLRTVVLRMCYGVATLLRVMPCKLTTLYIHTTLENCKHFHTDIAKLGLDLKELGSLSCLTTLHLDDMPGTVTGIEHISGLTKLQCNNPLGHLAHLAPTLKHLAAWEYDHVPDLDKLTNLEVLCVRYGMPANFFEVNGHLPLKHLCPTWPRDTKEPLYVAKAWESAPTTLTGLTMHDVVPIPEGVLPTTVTHLQLVCSFSDHIKQAITLMPGLRRLDLHLYDELYRYWSQGFSYLNRLTNLQSLQLFVGNLVYDRVCCWRRHDAFLKVPELQLAIGRGVRVDILEDYDGFVDMFVDRPTKKTAWITHGQA